MKTESDSLSACLRESARGLSGARWLRLTVLVALVALVLGGAADPESGPALLDRLGSWPGFGRGPAADVAVANHHAFVAIEEGGLLVLDVTDPSKLVRVASYPLAGQTKFVRVSGSRAYVATRVPRGGGGGGGCRAKQWRGRLVILDISDPAKPALLGSYTTSQEIQCLFADGNRVYLSDSTDGPHIVDVTDPTRPGALSVGKPDDCRGVSALWANSSRLYCAMYNYWVVVDVSEPTSPKIVADFDSAAGLPLRGICGRDNSVFVVEGDFGYQGEADHGCLSVFSSDAAGALVRKGKLEMRSAALNVIVSGTTAFVTAGPAGIVAVDVSNPVKPIPLGKLDTPGMAVALAMVGTNAYVADYHGGLQVIAVQNPGQPSLVSAFDTGLTTRELRVSGDKAYLVSSDTHPAFQTGYEARSRLEIVDVKDPTQPALLATYDLPKLILTLDTSDDLVCLGYNQLDRVSGKEKQGMQLLDVTTLTNLVCLSDTPVGTSAGYLALRVQDEHVFVASSSDSSSFKIFDISDPATPLLLGRTNSDYAYEEIRLSGGLAYLGHDSGLGVYDVADLRAPHPLGSVAFEYSSNDDCFT